MAKRIQARKPNMETVIFQSVSEASRKLDVSKQTLYRWIEDPDAAKRSANGWQFCWADGNSVEVEFELDNKDKVINNAHNIKVWLTAKYDSFAYNELTSTMEINGAPVDDNMLDRICVAMEESININNDKKTRQCITDLCVENTYNPLKEEIESVEWDGKERAETFFIDFLGAHDNQLNRFYTRCWLKAAVKRLYEPGCMWDNMIILYDKNQGTGKTKILQRLSLGMYAQDPEIGNKDAIGVMNAAWLINFDELKRFDSKEMNALKTFITTSHDVNRQAYARYTKVFPRHCVFCGTTNEEFFLRDYTSDRERRFWIINCNGTRKPDQWWRENLPNSYIKQVWAEVYQWYKDDPEIDNKMSIELQDDEQLVQLGHKSYGNDPQFQILLREALDKKYSKAAFDNLKIFQNEAVSIDSTFERSYKIDKIEVKRLAAAFNKQENYTASVIASLGDWIIRDGYAIRRTNGQNEINFDISNY